MPCGPGCPALSLTPKDFWGMTPAELEAAMEGRFGSAPATPFSRADFEALLRAYARRGWWLRAHRLRRAWSTVSA